MAVTEGGKGGCYSRAGAPHRAVKRGLYELRYRVFQESAFPVDLECDIVEEQSPP